MACVTVSLASATPAVAPSLRRAAHVRRGGSVVVRGKKAAFFKEFDEQYQKDNEVKEMDENVMKGWPGLAKDIGDDIATYNVLTKKTGPLNVTWNGVAMLQVPKGKTDKESNAIAKTVLIQRKEIVLQEVDRLYPKMKGQPKDYVIQMFEDPFADPVDMTQEAPNDVETAPAEFKFLEKGRRYPY